MMFQKVLAVDPGVTSGYMAAVVDTEAFAIVTCPSWGEIAYKSTTDISMLRDLASWADVIVIEDFVVRQALIGDRLLTIRLIGYLELTWRESKLIVFQQPIQKGEFKDSRLRALGFTHKSLHARDACRHMLIYLSTLRRKATGKDVRKQRRAKFARGKT